MPDNKKNSTWLAIQYVTVILSSFVALKLNISHFGTELFGAFILISSFWGFGTLIDLGFGTAMVKFIAQSKHDEESDFNTLVSTGLSIFLLAGTVILILGNVLARYIIFNNPKLIPVKFSAYAHPVFLLMGVFFFTQYLGVFFRSIIEGLNEFWVSSRITIVYNIMIFISVIIVVSSGRNLVVLAGCYIFCSACSLIFTAFYVSIKYGIPIFKFSLFSFKLFRKVLRFSISVQLTSLAGAAIDPVIKFLIGNYASINVVSYYEIAKRFSNALSGLFTTTFKYYLPKTSILKSVDDYRQFLTEGGANLSRLGITYSGFAFGVLQIVIALVIKIFFGYNEVIFIFLLLSLSEITNNFGYVLFMFLMGIGKADFLVILQTIYLVMLFITVMTGLLIFKSMMGLLGNFIASVIMNVLLLWYVQKLSGLSTKDYLVFANIKKYFILISLIILTIVSQYFNIMPVIPALSVLSFISIIIFFNDIKSVFLNNLKLRL